MPDPRNQDVSSGATSAPPEPVASAEPRAVLDRLWSVLAEVVTLDVHTVRGTPSGAQGHRVGQRPDALSVRPDQLVSTSINLIGGDIQTVVPPDFFEPSQAAFRDYHLAQVSLARDIAEGNMKAVAEVIERLSGTKSG